MNTNFNIRQTLECGQVFRFCEPTPHTFRIIAQNNFGIYNEETDNNLDEYNEFWYNYFDGETDYSQIKKVLSSKDEHMKNAVEFGGGIRILKQDPWEMLISFIISQNNGIPNIKKSIENICAKYGSKNQMHGEDYYAFPTVEQLVLATNEGLRECKVGFRDKYILDACAKVSDGTIDLNQIYNMNSDDAREYLMQISGVGPKVSDCILLFAYKKNDIFPTDVWIKRVMEGLYFNGEEQSLKKIKDFALDYYGDLAGYAQQYLFYYARENQLFKK
ncbi:MAG: 8-oxoguanine DNA glycosylase [Epulopiscium sp. Nele67-Bin005]|nr:MAG: 8-oxoguanine DNA glycosylase [Epulopiscium sp. Nele67-Bin005]